MTIHLGPVLNLSPGRPKLPLSLSKPGPSPVFPARALCAHCAARLSPLLSTAHPSPLRRSCQVSHHLDTPSLLSVLSSCPPVPPHLFSSLLERKLSRAHRRFPPRPHDFFPRNVSPSSPMLLGDRVSTHRQRRPPPLEDLGAATIAFHDSPSPHRSVMPPPPSSLKT
jgi:hypothetical protein